MNAKEVLTEAARLLRDVGWTQAFLAEDCYGRGVHPMDPGAACYCMIGAIQRAACGDLLDYGHAMHQLAREVGSIADYNGHEARTKEECIANLLEAAEL